MGILLQVEWSEINAAWGQTVLLLHSLARKMNLTFKRSFILFLFYPSSSLFYSFVPRGGSMSKKTSNSLIPGIVLYHLVIILIWKVWMINRRNCLCKYRTRNFNLLVTLLDGKLSVGNYGFRRHFPARHFKIVESTVQLKSVFYLD